EALNLQPDETVLVIGQGPIGLMLALLAKRSGASVVTSDLYPQRLTIAEGYGLNQTVNASFEDAGRKVKHLTEGRGADAVILAVGVNSLVRPAIQGARPGGRVMLFAQTQDSECTSDPAAICGAGNALMGSYSASIDLQGENIRLVYSGEIHFARLITHRFPLDRAVEALEVAANPGPDSMKVVVQPGMQWERT